MADWFSKLRLTDELRALKTSEDLRRRTGTVNLKVTNFKLMSHSHLLVYKFRLKTQEKWKAKHSISTMNSFSFGSLHRLIFANSFCDYDHFSLYFLYYI